MNAILESVGGRKFLFGMLAEIAALVLCLSDKITGDQFIGFTEIVAGIFMGANVVEKVLTKAPVKVIEKKAE